MDTSGWSAQAHQNHKAASSARADYEAKIEAETERMKLGPHLLDDGHTLVIPSDWYHREAAIFWKQYDFHWNRQEKVWMRDTSAWLQKKHYSAEAWLESTRREFFKFWPMLDKEKEQDDEGK